MDGTHEGMERMMATAGEWEVTGQRVLVTGASSGLGLAMARALAAGGARVALGARDAGRLGEAVRSLGATTADVRAVPLNVRDSASIPRAIAVIADAWGGLDVLVNNAGIGMRTVNPAFLTDPQPFWQVSEEGFTAVIETNLTGYFRVASAAVPLLLEAERGKIINISMNHETMRRRGFVPYGPSRAVTTSAIARTSHEEYTLHTKLNTGTHPTRRTGLAALPAPHHRLTVRRCADVCELDVAGGESE